MLDDPEGPDLIAEAQQLMELALQAGDIEAARQAWAIIEGIQRKDRALRAVEAAAAEMQRQGIRIITDQSE